MRQCAMKIMALKDSSLSSSSSAAPLKIDGEVVSGANYIHAANHATALHEEATLEPATLETMGEGAFAERRLGRRVAGAMSVTGLGSVLSMGLNAAAGIVIARRVGPAGYASFVAANMVVFVSAILCQCSLPLVLAKHIAREEELQRHETVRRLCATTLMWALGLALACGSVIAWNLGFLERHLRVAWGAGFAPVFPLILGCAIAGNCAVGTYLGLLRPARVLAVTAGGPLLMLLCVAARWHGAPWPMWSLVALSNAGSGFIGVLQLSRDRLLGRVLPPRAMRPLLRDVPPAFSFTFLMVFSTWSDRWIVGSHLGAAPLGLYSAAVSIVQSALRVPTNIAQLLVPASARAGLGEARDQAHFNAAIVSAFGWFSVLLALVLLLAGDAIVRGLFGELFAGAAPALLLMTPTLLAAMITLPLMSALTGSDSPLTARVLFVTLPLRVLLLIGGTRWAGLLGTALATALGDVMLAACCFVMARRGGMAFPLRALARPVAAGILALGVGGAARWAGLSQGLSLLIACVVFAPLLWRAARALRQDAGAL